MNISKKIVTFATMFSLVFGIQMAQPRQAHAVFGAGDTTIDIPNLLKEFGIDTLVTILQSRIIDKMVDDSLNWAVGGFDGEPGFVENWEDFLKDAGKTVLSAAFNSAAEVATDYDQIATGSSENNQIFQTCVAQVKADYPSPAEINAADCDVPVGQIPDEICFEDPNNYVNAIKSCRNQVNAQGYGSCLAGVDSSYPGGSTENCNAGSGGLVNIACVINKQNYLNAMESCDSQFGIISTSGFATAAGVLGGIASSNYDTWVSGEKQDARTVALAIAGSASKQINGDPLNSVINGKGETLSKLLGGQENKKAFSNDITKGGWTGYIALSDPHNYPSGVTALTENFLNEKVANKVKSTIDDIQTPQKFFDKKECADGATPNALGICPGAGKKKAKTTTPGQTVDQKTETANNKEVEQSLRAKELSDVLAKTLGKLALKLINVGLSQIGKKSGSSIAESAASNLPAFNYQNEYDILGIANDTPEIDAFGNIAGTGGGNMNQGIDEFGNFDIYSNDPSIPFIGGPEDVNSGDNWNEGVELVINLQEELEVAYENTKREIELFEEISEIMKEMKDNTVILDRCTPGPDFGWKERFTNVFDIAEIGNAGSGGTKSDAKAIESAQQEMVDPRLNKVALNEMRLMVVDPRINIPGSKTFSSVIENTLGDSSIKEFEGILKSQLDKKNTLFILEGMRDTISIDFRKYRTNIDSRLPLFHAEWNELSQLDKLALFSLPIKDENGNDIVVEKTDENGNPILDQNGDPITEIQYVFNKYYLLKTNLGETTATALANKPDQVREAVISYAWDLWRTQKSLDPAVVDASSNVLIPDGNRQKSNLRYQFYTIQNTISRKAQIVELEVRKTQAEKTTKLVANYMNDCIRFWEIAMKIDNDPKEPSEYLINMFKKKGSYKIPLDFDGLVTAALANIFTLGLAGPGVTYTTQMLTNEVKDSFDNGDNILPYAAMDKTNWSNENWRNNSSTDLDDSANNEDFRIPVEFSPKKNLYQLYVGDALSDIDIRNKLIEERNKYNTDPDSSIFKTPAVFSETNIERSILGDFSQTDSGSKAKYFTDRYSNEPYVDDTHPGDGISGRFISKLIGKFLNIESYFKIRTDYSTFLYNATSVKEILHQDYTAANFKNGGTGTGILFCRIPTAFDGDKGVGKQWVSNCIQDWYTTPDIDYAVLFSGV